MISILAILLYLQLISTDGSYSQSYIDGLQAQNQDAITSIQSDQTKYDQVQNQYDPQATSIVIFPEEKE